MLGHSIDDAAALAAKAKGLKVDDLLKYLSGSTTMKQTVPMLGQNLNFLTAGKFSKPIGRSLQEVRWVETLHVLFLVFQQR